MYIYFWLVYRKLSTITDWDPSNPDPVKTARQLNDMGDFIVYQLITQVLPPVDPYIPSNNCSLCNSNSASLPQGPL